ncbi:DUF421 domain-containing protein [Hymenobacter crusticola]|uniref:YetF C-terminal domain-containing protein n=1 Tax=Hymenobacter crusticola TaxID=1770526 RepID=A0A243WE61_9BACT|nr:YetF domain-containing protein [Hymenobacter crusticola]OUJ73993.1 hypothetical protein BXP70_09560 [Hymenobacter crusticola]
MKPEDIHPFDFLRIFLGEAPWSFLLEVVIRILFIFVLLIVSMRLMGKRMASQLSRNELAAMSSLAAAIGVPMQVPDRGLLPPLVMAVVIISIQRLSAVWSTRSQKFEKISQGDIGILLEDGCLQLSAMQEAVLPQERLFAQLRSEAIDNLGAVKRVYMEANGSFTILKQPKPQPGLSILPNWDQDFLREQRKVPGTFACQGCGNLAQDKQAPCSRCGKTVWTTAVTSEA